MVLPHTLISNATPEYKTGSKSWTQCSQNVLSPPPPPNFSKCSSLQMISSSLHRVSGIRFLDVGYSGILVIPTQNKTHLSQRDDIAGRTPSLNGTSSTQV